MAELVLGFQCSVNRIGSSQDVPIWPSPNRILADDGDSVLSCLCAQEAYHYTVPFVVFGAMMASVGFAGLLFPETLQRPLPNILPCRHRTIPLHEGVRLVTNPWDAL